VKSVRACDLVEAAFAPDHTQMNLLLWSLLRVVLIASLLAVCLAIAMAVGLVLADAGALGTCQDGTCQLVAAVYVMPIGGVALFLATLIVWSTIRKRRSER
jgi:hypothetical protein